MKKVLLLLFFSSSLIYSQEIAVKDSIQLELEKLPDDTSRAATLVRLIELVSLSNPAEALKYSIQLTQLSEKANYNAGKALGYSWQGYFYESFGEMDKSVQMYFKAASIYEKIDSLEELSTLYNNIAFDYLKMGNPEMALNYNMKSLKMDLQLKDTSSLIVSLINVSGIYYRQDKFNKALESLRAALKFAMQLDDELLISSSLRNIARVLKDQKDYDEAYFCYSLSFKLSSKINNREKMAKELNGMGNIMQLQGYYPSALDYYRQALAVLSGFGYKREMGNTYINLANYYLHFNQHDSALFYYENALTNFRSMYDDEGISQTAYYLGDFYYKQKSFIQAEKHAFEAYQLAERLGYPTRIMNTSHLLYKCYEANAKFGQCVSINNRYLQIRDIVEQNEERKLIEKQKEKFDAYKQVHMNELEDADRSKKLKAKIARRNLLQYSFMALAFLICFGLILSLGYIKVSPRFSQAFIFLTLLMLFEFILALIDPIFDKLTGGIPYYKVLINSVLALSIFPIQSFMEKRLKTRLQKIK